MLLYAKLCHTMPMEHKGNACTPEPQFYIYIYDCVSSWLSSSNFVFFFTSPIHPEYSFSFLPSGWQFHFQRPFVQNSHHLSPACVSTIWNLHFKLSDWLISNPQPRSLTSLKQCHYFKNYIKLNDKLVPLFQPVVSISTAQCSVLDTWPFFFWQSWWSHF